MATTQFLNLYREMVKHWSLAIDGCRSCRYADHGWCVLSYKSCTRNRAEDGECKPQAILWEKKK